MPRPDLRTVLVGGEFPFRMGLAPVSAPAWLGERSEPRRARDRAACLDAHPERLAIRAREDLVEAEAWLGAHLGTVGPYESLARAIAVDTFVVERATATVSALAIAFPSGYAPEAMLGRPIGSIHAAVPRLGESLGPAIATFLARLDAGRAFGRSNVGLTRGLGLDRHPGLRADAIDRATSPEELVVRVEEQLFVGLGPAILFGIHLVELPLLELGAAERAALGAFVAAMPEEVRRYKGLAELPPGALVSPGIPEGSAP